jgi:hypothetical protein
MNANGFGPSARHVSAVLYVACQLTASRGNIVATGFANGRDDTGFTQDSGKGFHPFRGGSQKA